jgi:signal transduction histidine kinase/ActR/RegA family two-component response regulator
MAEQLTPKPTAASRDEELAVQSVLRRASAIPLVLIAVFGVIVLWQLSSRLADSRWVDHTDRVIATAEGTALNLTDSASNLRGFLLVGQDYLLERYEHSYDVANTNLHLLRGLVADNPSQVERVSDVTNLLLEWKDFTEQEVRLKRGSGDYESILRSKKTVNMMDSIRDELRQFIDVEQELRGERSATFNRGVHTAVALVAFGLFAIGTVLVFLGRRDVETVAQVFRATLAKEAYARSVAEEANRAKGQFLNTVSHELRNPLNSILMWVRALQVGGADAQRLSRGLSAIERGARSQSQLIDDLIDTARIESGKLRLNVHPVDIAQVIQSAIDTVALSAEGKQIRIQSMLDGNVGRVAGDADRLRQVFWNLLSNAVKFTPKGGRIQIRLERINSHLEISVSDTGRGIEPAELPKIFGRFWQADDTLTSGNHGLGLGLSIAQHIAELHGGNITAFSEGLGKGTLVQVRLPIMIAGSSTADFRRHPTLADQPPPMRLRLDGVTVLAVDDEPDAGLAIEALLNAVGAEVRIANSAEEALIVLDHWTPDVLVSDIGMPGTDGLALIREIRQRTKPLADVPALALTAYGRVDDKITILDAGYQAHVVKPVDAAELTAVIASLVRSDAHHHRAG